jgi:hypothetical protein
MTERIRVMKIEGSQMSGVTSEHALVKAKPRPPVRLKPDTTYDKDLAGQVG